MNKFFKIIVATIIALALIWRIFIYPYSKELQNSIEQDSTDLVFAQNNINMSDFYY
jgi:hypothetical protein